MWFLYVSPWERIDNWPKLSRKLGRPHDLLCAAPRAERKTCHYRWWLAPPRILLHPNTKKNDVVTSTPFFTTSTNVIPWVGTAKKHILNSSIHEAYIKQFSDLLGLSHMNFWFQANTCASPHPDDCVTSTFWSFFSFDFNIFILLLYDYLVMQ